MLLIYIFGLTTLIISNNVIRASPTHSRLHQSNYGPREIIALDVADPSNARFKRQEATLQQTLQNLQITQQQQSEAQRRPGQGGLNQSGGQGGFGGNQNQFGINNGFNNGQGSSSGFGTTASGQDTGFTNVEGVSSGFNQGFSSNGQNIGSNVSGNGQAGFSNGGNFGSGNGLNNNQGSAQGTTVRNPLNVASDENTIPEAACMRRCQALMQFNPVCGSDNITYTNEQRLRCAQQCGRQTQLVYYGTCVATQPPSTK